MLGSILMLKRVILMLKRVILGHFDAKRAILMLKRVILGHFDAKRVVLDHFIDKLTILTPNLDSRSESLSPNSLFDDNGKILCHSG